MTRGNPSPRLASILSLLKDVRPSAKGHMALCPAHADTNPSLSVREAPDGWIVLRCFAGCSRDSVCAALGIKMSDLAPDGERDGHRSDLGAAVQRVIAAVCKKEGGLWRCVAQYPYADAAENEQFRVLRLERDGADRRKTFRVIRLDMGRWLSGVPKGKVPPYRLAEVLPASRVFLGEGEKVVEAARQLGMVATTNAFGAGGVTRTDWSSLAGKELVLLPDNDDAGRKWTASLLDVLGRLEPRPRAVVLHLPDLPDGGDLVEFIVAARAGGRTNEDIRAELERLMKSSESNNGDAQRAPPARPTKRTPFPIELLPEPVRDLVEAIADSRSISLDVPAAVSLAALASAIGLSRVAYDPYADWLEVPVVWMAVVVRSGTRKTVVMNDLFEPHFQRQKKQSDEFARQKAQHADAYLQWKHHIKRHKSEEIPPEPAAPKLAHTYTTDATPEAIISILEDTPRGVAVVEDELSHFFGGLGLYSGKVDRDRAFYLALFRGLQYKGDRKGSGSIVIPMAAASIIGGIQPKVLMKSFDDAALYSGLASRFLLVDAPPQVKQYRQGPTPKMRSQYGRLIEALFGLPMDSYVDEFGEPRSAPQRVLLDEPARDLLREFVPEWSEESLLYRADVEAAMSKLEGYALRFALILRACREAEGRAESSDPITREDLEGGIRIARWFRDRALRVYADLRVGEGRALNSEVLARAEVIRHRFGGAVTRREWLKMNTRRSAEEAAKELDELVDAGLAAWRDRPPGPGGGRPTEECALVEPVEEGSAADTDGCDEEVSGCGLRGAARASEQPGDPSQGEDPQGVSGCSQEARVDATPSWDSAEGVSDRSGHGNPQPETRNQPPDRGPQKDAQPTEEEGFRGAPPLLDDPEEEAEWTA